MPRRRMGLLRTAKKAAVISGSATAASQMVQRRGRERELAKQDASSAPVGTRREGHDGHAEGGTDMVKSLERLAKLKTSGALSDKEYAAAKAKLLS
jgi:hypothetical protein